jgi:hypothetical protein
MTDENENTPDTHYVLVAAPGYYGDRTRILDAFPDLSSACEAAMQWGPQYVIRRSPRSRGEYWYCDLDHTPAEYWRADWNTGRIVHYPQPKPAPERKTTSEGAAWVEMRRYARGLVLTAMDQGLITTTDMVAVDWGAPDPPIIMVKRQDGTEFRLCAKDILGAKTAEQ